MTNAQHASGPWRAERDHEGMWNVWSKGCRWIAKILGSSAEADALLIAAAPESLDALLEARSLCLQAADGISGRRIIEKIDAAIGKARGESSLAA